MHETLNRLLWRYSEEHGGDNEWNGIEHHWFIFKNTASVEICVGDNSLSKSQSVVYFKDMETALSAIEEIVKPFMARHPEFVW